MNLRWLKKADGTKVLQQDISDKFSTTYKPNWVDILTIEEPKPKKKLCDVLYEAFMAYYMAPSKITESVWEFVAQAAREYLEKERRGE